MLTLGSCVAKEYVTVAVTVAPAPGKTVNGALQLYRLRIHNRRHEPDLAPEAHRLPRCQSVRSAESQSPRRRAGRYRSSGISHRIGAHCRFEQRSVSGPCRSLIPTRQVGLQIEIRAPPHSGRHARERPAPRLVAPRSRRHLLLDPELDCRYPIRGGDRSHTPVRALQRRVESIRAGGDICRHTSSCSLRSEK